jgi:hypothetical protein
MTSASKLSYCEQLKNSEDAHVVGKATWFISHAWKYTFLEVVEAIELFLKKEYNEHFGDVFVWFDMFSNSQHDTISKPFEWWKSIFTNAIKTINNVLMVLLPWDNPVTLTRAWCIFEIFACESTQSRFEVTMTAAETTRFLSMIRDATLFYNMLANIKSENATSYLPYDCERIFEVIRLVVTGGFTQLDSMVLRVLEKWMTSALLMEIEHLSHDHKPQEHSSHEHSSHVLSEHTELSKHHHEVSVHNTTTTCISHLTRTVEDNHELEIGTLISY